MSSLVCGKRTSSIFEEYHEVSPPSLSKRIRCSPSLSAVASPSSSSPPGAANSGCSSSVDVDRLRSLFPLLDPQLITLALEASGNDVDSAFKKLSDLHVGAEGNSVYGVSKSNIEDALNTQHERATGILINAAEGPISEESPSQDALTANGSDWVDLFVREMRAASGEDDAKARISKVLGILEKTIVAKARTEAMQTPNMESRILKEQMEAILQENAILKRAVAIQHERQKAYDEQSQESQHLKQLVSQYQEQQKILEMNNYALRLHFQQALQNNSIPGRFHPDVL